MGQCTDISWSYLLKRKIDLATTMIKFTKDLQAKHGKKKATIMRCGNAGEKHIMNSYLRKRYWV